jgi:hypothetical protein
MRLLVAGSLTVALFVVLAIIDGHLTDTGGPGIVPFELAFTSDRAVEILGDWGADGRDDARLSLWLDYAFLVAYAAFWRLAILRVRDALGWRRWPAIAAFPVAAAVFDALENAALLATIEQGGDQPWPALAGAFACVKFALLTPATLYAIAGAVALVARRRRAAP